MVNCDMTHVWELRPQRIKIQLTGEAEQQQRVSEEARVQVFALEKERAASLHSSQHNRHAAQRHHSHAHALISMRAHVHLGWHAGHIDAGMLALS